MVGHRDGFMAEHWFALPHLNYTGEGGTAMMLSSRNRTPVPCVTDLGAMTLGAIAALLLATVPAGAEEPNKPGAFVETDCRYLTSGHPQAALDPVPLGKVWFPHDDIFRPLLADMKQPRFYVSFRNVDFRTGGLPAGGTDDTIKAAIGGMGKDFGLWRRSTRHRCDGLQVSILGGVFSQFNLDTSSDDLINTDFLVGPELTLRRGPVSARLRIYHQSSHLGDEFILNNPGVDRVNLSFEVFDGLVAFTGRWWRLYVGGGYILSSDSDLPGDGLGQGGFELRGLRFGHKASRGTLVFGTDWQSFEARDWDFTTSVKGGIELSNPAGSNRFRVLLVYLRGSVPFGQFFNTERIENYGLELQFDF